MAKRLTRKEAEMVEGCYFQPRYSGSGSDRFWREVRFPSNDRVLYDFALSLADLEFRVLACVNEGVRVRAQKAIIKSRRKAKG